jgi:hypothetical protein
MAQEVLVSWELIVSGVMGLLGVLGSLVTAVVFLYKNIIERMNKIIANCEAEHQKTRDEANAQISNYKADLERVNAVCDTLTEKVTVLTGKVSYYEGLNSKKKK